MKSSLTYCLAARGQCNESRFQEIVKIHVWAAQIIHGIASDNADDHVLHKARWDTISYLYKRKLLIIMQDSHLQKLPGRICDLFNKCNNTKRHLRSGTKLMSLSTGLMQGHTQFAIEDHFYGMASKQIKRK